MKDDDIIILSDSELESLTVTDSCMINLDYPAAQPALTSCDIQTLSIDDLITSCSTITLPSSTYTISGGGASGVTYTTNTGGGGGGSGGIYTTNTAGTGYTWTQSYSPTVNIDNDGLNVREGGDIKIGNVSLKDFISKMEQRLAILVPDPEKLEKFQALKKAYEHYKTMEALCFPDEKDKKE